MKRRFPADCSSRSIGTRARGIVVYKLDTEIWEWHELTGTDHGTDILIELVENGEFTNKKIEGQIKGSTNIVLLQNGCISFNLEVKTINYALNSSSAFVLFLVDVCEEIVYYLAIQDYFIAHTDRFVALEKNKTTVTVHIDPRNKLDADAFELCEIAKSVYVDGPSRKLRKIV